MTPSPATPLVQQKTFSLPPGFEIELVASEEQGVSKPITVAWDDAGRLWTITALEYPLDGNEQPAAAKALYEKGGRDQVLVFDKSYGSTPGQPRVFADGLAMPMGILPYKDGALVGHGPDVLFLRDTDGDGKADKRELILTGFGIQDSHLMPHQFTRAPGGWFWLAQGAFNYSRVKTKDGREHQFDQTRLARFTVDGMKFEDVTSGPCNIWGLVIDPEGETFIQEANDFGYPVMHYQQGGSYPGCTGPFKPYAPYHPSEVEFRMGGTGLSGLALSDPASSFPPPYAHVMYVANPITRKVQAIKIHREGPRFRYEKLPDFVLSSDEWFRPVAIHFGPDGCLYIVDWYNKIISHNEVPRTHPERDKTRGRVWRVRHKEQSRSEPPNVLAAKDDDLLKHLVSQSTWEMRAALHQIVDRPVPALLPRIKQLAEDSSRSGAHRIHALWVLEELQRLELMTVQRLLGSDNRNLRREAIRSLQNLNFNVSEVLPLIVNFAEDHDPEVRAEVIRTAAKYATENSSALALMLTMAKAPLEGPVGKNPHSGAPMKLREAYDREFERYLVRAYLEKIPAEVGRFLSSPEAQSVPTEGRLIGALALPAEASPSAVANLISKIERPPNEEEVLRLAIKAESPEARDVLASLLQAPARRRAVLEALIKVRNRANLSGLVPILGQVVKALWTGDASERSLAISTATAFKVRSAEPLFITALESPVTSAEDQAILLRALREMESSNAVVFARLARESSAPAVRNEALNALASVKAPESAGLLLQFWNDLTPAQKRFALGELSSTRGGALMLTRAIGTVIPKDDLDGNTLEKLIAVLPGHPEVSTLAAELSGRFKPVLVLDGQNESYVDSNITLDGAFTVETWVKLDPNISNADGILARPGGADFNFAGGHFRVWCGQEFGDRLIARKPTLPEAWTHFAVVRDPQGVFSLYINGELDSRDARAVTNSLTDLDIGRTIPNNGTSGSLAEFRVWNRARSGEEIRREFDRSYAGQTNVPGLVHAFGSGWNHLRGGARVEKTTDAPPLLTAEEAEQQNHKFSLFGALLHQAGDINTGKEVFATTCAVCHSVGGKGGQIGPVLDGAGAMGAETLLRAILTPNAAMEAGYRTFRVELQDGDVLDGFLVSRETDALVLRRPNIQDERIPLAHIKRAGFTRNSLMPEGLLEALREKEVADLFAYLRALK